MNDRDFEAERVWLLNLPTSPETDRKQDEWERDPEVIRWRETYPYQAGEEVK